MVWRRESVIRLIGLYRQNSVLWDPTSPDYKDRAKKRKAWAELAAVLKMNPQAVETKMRGLIGQFQRELRRGNSIYGGKTLYYSEWIYFKKLLFLKEKTEAKFARSKPRSPSPCDKDIAELQDINYSLLLGDIKTSVINKRPPQHTVKNQSQRPLRCPTVKATCYIPPRSPVSTEVKKELKEENSKGVITAIQQPVTTFNDSKSVDTSEECEGIAMLWISKLRKLDEVQRVIAENLITQVFTKAYFLQLTRNTQISDAHSTKEMDFIKRHR